MSAPMTHEEATLAVVRDVLADPMWTARVVAAAVVVAEHELTQAARVPAQDVVLTASALLGAALSFRPEPQPVKPPAFENTPFGFESEEVDA